MEIEEHLFYSKSYYKQRIEEEIWWKKGNTTTLHIIGINIKYSLNYVKRNVLFEFRLPNLCWKSGCFNNINKNTIYLLITLNNFFPFFSGRQIIPEKQTKRTHFTCRCYLLILFSGLKFQLNPILKGNLN